MTFSEMILRWGGLNKYVKWVYAYGVISVIFWYVVYFGIRAEENPIPYEIYFTGLAYRSSLFITMTAIAHYIVSIVYAKSSSKDLFD